MRTGILRKGVFIHIGVGLCVARFEKMGNARASVRGTSNGSTPTLFLCCKTIKLNINRLFGSQGHKSIMPMQHKY